VNGHLRAAREAGSSEANDLSLRSVDLCNVDTARTPKCPQRSAPSTLPVLLLNFPVKFGFGSMLEDDASTGPSAAMRAKNFAPALPSGPCGPVAPVGPATP
jgi:hypothetical protein